MNHKLEKMLIFDQKILEVANIKNLQQMQFLEQQIKTNGLLCDCIYCIKKVKKNRQKRIYSKHDWSN